MPVCARCGCIESLTRKQGSPRWYKHSKFPNGILCNRCFLSEIKKDVPNVFKGLKHIHSQESLQHFREGHKRHPSRPGMLGRCHTEQAKEIMSIKHRGLSSINLGKVMSDEQKKKISISKTGKKIPKLSVARQGVKPWNYRKLGCYSEETRKKMGVNHIGKSSWNKGIAPKLETIEKIRTARLKQVYPNKDTRIEVAIQQALRSISIDFKTHVPIIGQPDIFIEPNIAVFCDGDYWHCHPRYDNVKMTGKFTGEQIKERDRKVTDTLQSQGYQVLRFWESEIKADLAGCIKKIQEAIILSQ